MKKSEQEPAISNVVKTGWERRVAKAEPCSEPCKTRLINETTSSQTKKSPAFKKVFLNLIFQIFKRLETLFITNLFVKGNA